VQKVYYAQTGPTSNVCDHVGHHVSLATECLLDEGGGANPKNAMRAEESSMAEPATE
jgi:hypothetical protein